MAHTLENLQNKVKGSAGNITFYELNSQLVVRSKAIRIKNPRTPAQQLNRMNVINCLVAYRQLKPLIIRTLNNRTENQMAVHKFFALNLNKAFKNGEFRPAELLISGNAFFNDAFEYDVLLSNENIFTFSWAPSIIGSKNNSDIFCIASFNEVSNIFNYYITSANRSDGICQLTINCGSLNSKTYLYLFFIKSDYSDSGNHALIEFINS